MNFRFWILIGIVAISGFNQGLLLPLIAIIFENDGVSSSINGLNAAALYIGILFITPFMEPQLRKYGYKPIIIFGGLLIIISLMLFPLWKTFWFWFLLRFIIGIGDHALHFSTQTWITTTSEANKRGRNISIYGLSFGVGLAVGPLMTPLVQFSEALPFMLSSLLCFITWMLIFILKNEFPEKTNDSDSFREMMNRFSKAWKYGWVAILPPLGYGFLEASLNGSFPVYGLRIGFNIENISLLLFAFALGAIVFQLPLGMISDKVGRRNVLITILLLGMISFLFASLLEHSLLALTICLFIAGMVVGSTFSLGISYMTDLLPKNLLPAGNLLCGVAYSVGSLAGPYFGGIVIQYFSSISFFHIVAIVLFLLLIAVISFREKSTKSDQLIYKNTVNNS
ncbi:MFS transporter [Chengkuizengella sp. SCS-71B]|uniref:MFS transporter n=1 Tax=Chengkuizengella sp. SCS-71B TaxID=3115290 RepID=UPI0032C22C7E